MHNFQYVKPEKLSSVKKDLIAIINSVQDLVRKDFTFQFNFIGSIQRNMVTYDVRTNVGFDFDVDLQINDECKFTAKQIKTQIRMALDEVAPRFGYACAEDSTRVLTIKVKDRKNSKILHSCDFAIVKNYIDEDGIDRQKYIRFNKKQNNYTWEKQPKGYYLLSEKEEWMKDNGYWNEMTKLYLHKKNKNNVLHKHSRSIYAETIHEICKKYGYYK